MKNIIRGRMQLLDQQGGKLCAVSILALNDNTTSNGWRYTNLEAHLEQFRRIPILTAYTDAGDGIGGGHSFDVQKDEEGHEYASFTSADSERIVGWIPSDADIRLEERENGLWICTSGYLWRWYARELVNKLGDGSMDVSIETLVTRDHTEPDGTEVEEEYTVLGITILGNGNRPAVKGAEIRRLNAESVEAGLTELEETLADERLQNRVEDLAGQCSLLREQTEALSRERAALQEQLLQFGGLLQKLQEQTELHLVNTARPAACWSLPQTAEPATVAERLKLKGGIL